ncbi:MAG: aspartate kinase [Thermaerobacter sp.]|nr:aspartate kinase [Thermaerobacter sp.]
MVQPVIVMKFGGSSLATPERIRHVAQRIARRRKDGYDVIAVVSAQGDTTDELLERLRAVAPNPPAREVDMLLATGEQQSAALIAASLSALGIDAISLTGWQAGIATDGNHRRARIHTVTPHSVRRALSAGRVAVVAGFQGISGEFEVTTLGRGGSDLTAVALAASLGAGCEIYSDVAGVYTADPRIVPDARVLQEISYDEMMELAAMGAQVLQGRAVEYAWHHGVPIRALSTFDDSPGTLVREGSTMERVQAVTGVALDRHVSRVLCESVPDRAGTAAAIFGGLAEAGVNVDVIVQSPSREDRTDIAFTVSDEDAQAAFEITKSLLQRLGAEGATLDPNVAKVSVVGAGMLSRPGVASRAFRAIADAGVNIIAISTSEIKISCLVRRDGAEASARALHAAFDLALESNPS